MFFHARWLIAVERDQENLLPIFKVKLLKVKVACLIRCLWDFQIGHRFFFGNYGNFAPKIRQSYSCWAWSSFVRYGSFFGNEFEMSERFLIDFFLFILFFFALGNWYPSESLKFWQWKKFDNVSQLVNLSDVCALEHVRTFWKALYELNRIISTQGPCTATTTSTRAPKNAVLNHNLFQNAQKCMATWANTKTIFDMTSQPGSYFRLQPKLIPYFITFHFHLAQRKQKRTTWRVCGLNHKKRRQSMQLLLPNIVTNAAILFGKHNKKPVSS